MPSVIPPGLGIVALDSVHPVVILSRSGETRSGERVDARYVPAYHAYATEPLYPVRRITTVTATVMLIDKEIQS